MPGVLALAENAKTTRYDFIGEAEVTVTYRVRQLNENFTLYCEVKSIKGSGDAKGADLDVTDFRGAKYLKWYDAPVELFEDVSEQAGSARSKRGKFSLG